MKIFIIEDMIQSNVEVQTGNSGFLGLIEDAKEQSKSFSRRKSFFVQTRNDRFDKIKRIKIANQTPSLEIEINRALWKGVILRISIYLSNC